MCNKMSSCNFQYSVLALPFVYWIGESCAACCTAGVLVTLEPLPFANAEGPLQLITAPRMSVGQSANLSHHAEQPTATTQLVYDQSPAKHPGMFHTVRLTYLCILTRFSTTTLTLVIARSSEVVTRTIVCSSSETPCQACSWPWHVCPDCLLHWSQPGF